MWLLFSLFFCGEVFLLNVGNLLGTNLHPTSVKYMEIFQENFVGLYHHVFTSIILSYMMYYNTWCLNSDGSISFTESITCIRNSVDKHLYTNIVLCELAHYTVALLHTLGWKQIKRADQNMLFAHHIITIFLIYSASVLPVGEFATVYILFTHNLCDIPINIYLLMKNLKVAHVHLNGTLVIILDYANGLLLIILWAYLRLYMFGSLVGGIVSIFHTETNLLVKIACCILYTFDLIWFYMTIKAVVNEVIVKNDNSTLYDNATVYATKSDPGSFE